MNPMQLLGDVVKQVTCSKYVQDFFMLSYQYETTFRRNFTDMLNVSHVRCETFQKFIMSFYWGEPNNLAKGYHYVHP